MLTKEGEMIKNIKGVGESDTEMDLYTSLLDQIICKKLQMYSEIKQKITEYKWVDNIESI